MTDNFHERYGDEEEVKLPSEKSFGITFAVVFALVGLFPLVHGGNWRPWAVVVSLVFLVIAFVKPDILRPLNRVWMKFGLLLHKIVNPLVLGLMFMLIIAPIGTVMRLFGSDLLTPRPDPNASSYWIKRDPPGPDPESIRNQF